MKTSKPLALSFLAIVLFQGLFFTTLLLFYHIITIPMPYIKPLSYDYYLWLVQQTTTPMDSFFHALAAMLNSLFQVCFITAITYILFTRDLRKAVGGKSWVFSILIGLLTYAIAFLLIRYVAEHYRLYMTMIPNQILSLMLLYYLIVIQTRKLFGKKEVEEPENDTSEIQVNTEAIEQELLSPSPADDNVIK